MARQLFNVVTVTLPVDTAQYADGDLLSQAVEIADALVPNRENWLESLTLIDLDDQAAAVDLLFFDSNPGDLGTVNNAMAINNTQAKKLLGIVVVGSDYTDLGSQQIADPQFNPIKVYPSDGQGSIYVAGVSGGTPTYANGELVLKFGISVRM